MRMWDIVLYLLVFNMSLAVLNEAGIFGVEIYDTGAESTAERLRITVDSAKDDLIPDTGLGEPIDSTIGYTALIITGFFLLFRIIKNTFMTHALLIHLGIPAGIAVAIGVLADLVIVIGLIQFVSNRTIES